MKIKGSTLIIALMYLTWVAYLAFQVAVRIVTGAFLPAEVTYGTAALFIVETVSLARLKMAKEGAQPPTKKPNPFLANLGLGGVPDFEEETQEENAKNAKGEADGLEGKGVQ